MEIRLQLKTHYQVSRPGIFSVLLTQCTSLNQSNYPENISAKLAKIKFSQISLNSESAKFVVAMAQTSGLLTKNMFWDWRGHAIALLLEETLRQQPDDYLNLTFSEKILYLKYYLEADGAAILEISKRIKSMGVLTRNELLSTDIIDQIFIETWESYRQLTSDLRQKVQLKDNIRRLKSKPYTYKTRIHKALSHVEPLSDFDFIERKEEKNTISYYPKVYNNFIPIERLTEQIDSIAKMEWLFDKFQHFKIIGNIYGLNFNTYDSKIHSKALLEDIVKVYLRARTQPYKMASIATISDVISAKYLAEKKILIARPDVEKELDLLKKDHQRDIYFHVDMYGRKSFIVLSDKFCEAYK